MYNRSQDILNPYRKREKPQVPLTYTSRLLSPSHTTYYSHGRQHCEIRKSKTSYTAVRLYNVIMPNNCSADAALRCAAPTTAIIETAHERIFCLLYYIIM